ncbi:TonB-linked outer membrane protein, SusC/RagA family [Filimonas lacunae]|uniref:TonB-linked outer membrane protein, SusC/RagA family n=1 Tax=Filimonas lacunae TaxID=477680 RepID=A0A173MBI3_9BACT|nr:TonB-dependent receptor [Filimonas lacunae]BAV04859.1 TonB-dependent receptor [Filimonas lacunae]SIT34656.1 TonB-linked outer membrane protein, SusC/RagA family [Filimonas lacunae]
MTEKLLWSGIKRCVLFLLLTPLCTIAFSQNNEITVQGKVSSDSALLENVTVQLKSNMKRVTQTDAKGNFLIKVPANGTLLFSIVGFETQEMNIAGRGTIDVLMKHMSNNLNDIVITGFGGTQKKASAVSAITTVDVKDLKGPTGNLTNTLAGRIPGMISFQRSGEPGRGSDNSSFYIRGLSTFGTGKQDPLILIDGVESSSIDMARLQPDDISDFSVLKDAAAASVYGARGANGVVLINTKTGKEGTAKFFFRLENRLSSNTKNFKFADNVTYMELANEAALTRSALAIQPYSQNKIEHTRAGDDPILYPNNNWIEQLIKKHTINQSYNMNVSGGSTRARYYVAGTYNQDNGVLKVDPINNFNSNIKLKNYSLRININLNLTNTTELILRTYGQFDDYSGPINGGATTFNNAIWSNPVMFPAVYPQSKLPYIEHPLFGSAQVTNGAAVAPLLYLNPYAEMVKGYTVYKTSNIQPQLELKQNLNFITPGLSFRTMGYLRRYSYYAVNRNYYPFYYSALIDPNTKDYNLVALNDGGTTSIDTVGTEYLNYKEGNKIVDSRFWLEGSVNYNHTFNRHTVGGSLIGVISNYETGNSGSVTASLPQRNQTFSGRFTYGYDNRYLAEFNFGYNGSERFARNNRFGFFPSAGIGYRISNERFFEPLKSVVNDLKLRATYGLVGNDQIGDIDDRFFYLSKVNLNDNNFGASFGRNDGATPYFRQGISISRYANNDITWEKSRSLNLGMDLKMFVDLTLTVDVYKQWRSNILQPKSSAESAAGFSATPYANYGKAETQGIDLAANYQHSINRNWWVSVRGTFTYATSKVKVADEIQYPKNIAYLSKVNRSISQGWGLVAERLFIDTKEVQNSPIQYGYSNLLGGDIKYKDVNGDGVVNDDDMVPIGYPQDPEIIYGFGASTGYKRFDISFYFQGSARSTFFINPANIQPFYLNGRYQNNLLKVIADDHWSETNQNPYAFYPRLSGTYQIDANNKSSTWWMRSGDFLRLKSVDIGYTIPEMKAVKMKGVRVYMSATNLFVISSFKLWDVEMGGKGLGYPVQSVYSLGAQLNF